MAIINHDAELARAGANVSSTGGQILFLARRYPLGAVGALIVLLFIFTAAFANFIAPMDPTATNAKFSLAKPGAEYWLGADFMGRDMFSRIVYGARISLAVGAGATLLGGVLGVTIGLMSGYLGGWVDSVIMRWVDFMLALPGPLVAIVVVGVIGGGYWTAVLVLVILFTAPDTRIARSAVVGQRPLPYIDAARALGIGMPLAFVGVTLLTHSSPGSTGSPPCWSVQCWLQPTRCSPRRSWAERTSQPGCAGC